MNPRNAPPGALKQLDAKITARAGWGSWRMGAGVVSDDESPVALGVPRQGQATGCAHQPLLAKTT